MPVISLFGVVLIARPPFIFGSSGGDHEDEYLGPTIYHGVTTEQRMAAVWYVFALSSYACVFMQSLVFP